MDNQFSSIIDAAASILILLPERPTFDSVTAGLSLYMSLMDKKPVSISCPSPMMVGFNRIIGIQRISSELGNKNLTIKFKNYDAANIEKVSYDIINGEFNLTVVPKAGLMSPTQEQMSVGFSGVSADLVILVGGADDNDFSAISSQDFAGAKLAHVGNRALATNKEVMSLARPASSISELVAALIRDNNFAIDPDIATNLVMGVEEGSSNFANAEVTPDTFELFAYLLRNGGQRSPRTKLSPASFPPGSIPSQPFNAPQPLSVMPVQAPAGYVPNENDAHDIEGTKETEAEINPPDDWLQPKIFKGAQNPTQNQQPSSFGENKG